MSSLDIVSFVSSSLSRTRNLPQLCSVRRNVEKSVSDMFRSPLARVDYLPEIILMILYYAGLNCMRISELLEVRVRDRVDAQRYVAHGAKRSRSYIVLLPGLNDAPVVSSCKDGSTRLFNVPYKTVWSWCQRIGLGFTPEQRQTVARTHAHRYVVARQIVTHTNDVVAGDVLHHRSRASISYYINKRGSDHGNASKWNNGKHQR